MAKRLLCFCWILTGDPRRLTRIDELPYILRRAWTGSWYASGMKWDDALKILGI